MLYILIGGYVQMSDSKQVYCILNNWCIWIDLSCGEAHPRTPQNNDTATTTTTNNNIIIIIISSSTSTSNSNSNSTITITTTTTNNNNNNNRCWTIACSPQHGLRRVSVGS